MDHAGRAGTAGERAQALVRLLGEWMAAGRHATGPLSVAAYNNRHDAGAGGCLGEIRSLERRTIDALLEFRNDPKP